jgi:HicB family
MALRKEEFHYDPYKEKKSMDKSNSAKKRITIDISSELEIRIAEAAEQQKISINQYLENVLREAVPTRPESQRVRRPITPENVEKLMQIRDRILQEHSGQSFENSVELLRQEREEREKELDF